MQATVHLKSKGKKPLFSGSITHYKLLRQYSSPHLTHSCETPRSTHFQPLSQVWRCDFQSLASVRGHELCKLTCLQKQCFWRISVSIGSAFKGAKYLFYVHTSPLSCFEGLDSQMHVFQDSFTLCVRSSALRHSWVTERSIDSLFYPANLTRLLHVLQWGRCARHIFGLHFPLFS